MQIRRWAVALLALILVGCGAPAAPPSIAVGATSEPESQLVAHLYAAALRFYGSPAQVKSVPDPVAELDSGDVLVAPGSTGQLLAIFDPDATARADAQVYRALLSALPEGVAAGDYTTSAEDKPAIAVTEQTAGAWDGRDVTAAVRNCAKIVAGVLAGAATPSKVGPCAMPKPREFRDSATLFSALRAGQINAAWTTEATPNIPTELVVLSDKTALIRAENLVPLYRRNELNEQQVLALNEVAGVLDSGSLVDMRRQVAEGKEPGLVADAWLDAHPLGR
ncbi:ABC type transport system periplasmic glycine betaine/choline-binding (lipo)protein osmoprotectant binding protein [Mycobacterium sp. JS623]|uniref:glycine betaine ABC transporter substrate-binding protein n=1 Tax=Mycobacterium sp. JS623 TaxID=212767 RepID=UPI0002A553FC|nr:glycine betaine ABC transporter substrate-binding protein [Mycobacterium sp. JS623]AGB25059.1 ABC type transport system periplasmic glycine betaine/choline-binding (lipo)protein osmoprotectant binding protein [Mycobacterium sp. JS623]